MGAQRSKDHSHRCWDWIKDFGKSLWHAAPVVGVLLGGGLIQLLSYIHAFKGAWRWISLGVVILALLLLGMIVYSQERRKNKALDNERRALDKRDEVVEAWDVAMRAFNKSKDAPIWDYKRINLEYRITNQFDLEYEDRSEVNIRDGELEFYTYSFSSDDMATPLESLKNSEGFHVILDCPNNRGAVIDCRVNDISGHHKDLFVMFPAPLEKGYPCNVQMSLKWPGFWNTLKETGSDEVAFEATEEVEVFEQTVIFPEGLGEERVGFTPVPNKDEYSMHLNGECRLVLRWKIDRPDKGKRYVMRFTIFDS